MYWSGSKEVVLMASRVACWEGEEILFGDDIEGSGA